MFARHTMALTEFELIAKFFARPRVARGDVILGVGDDAAVVRVPEGAEVVVEITTLAGAEMAESRNPRDLGHRSLALPLARVAARGASPCWATLALTQRQADAAWLNAFSDGLLSLAARHAVQLIGGDTTRGPASATVHAHGQVARGRAVPAAQSNPGDLVYVTGALGDTALAVLALTGELQLPVTPRQQVLDHAARPAPPVAYGPVLAGLATGATSLGDGLAAGLDALLRDAGAGATVQVERLPVSPTLAANFERAGGWTLPLHSQEPCGLCFTVPPDLQDELERRLRDVDPPCTWVGTVEGRAGLRCTLDDGTLFYSSEP